MEAKKKRLNIEEIFSDQYKDALDEIRKAWKNTIDRYIQGKEKNVEQTNNPLILDEEGEENINVKTNNKVTKKRKNKNSSNEKKVRKTKKKKNE